jgi:hypothetical protein
MNPNVLEMELPNGIIPTPRQQIATPEDNDLWHQENHRLRRLRGDFSRSQTPVNVPFVMEEALDTNASE